MDAVNSTNPFFPVPAPGADPLDGMNTRISQRALEWEQLMNNQPLKELMWQLSVNFPRLNIAKLVRFSDITGRAGASSVEECSGENHALADRLKTDHGQFFEKPPLSGEFYLAGSEAQLVAYVCHFGIYEEEEKTCSKVAYLQTLLGCGNIGGNPTPLPGDMWSQIKDQLSPADRSNLRTTCRFLLSMTGSHPMTINLSEIKGDFVSSLRVFIGNLNKSDVNLSITKNQHGSMSTEVFGLLFDSLAKNSYIQRIWLSDSYYALPDYTIKMLGKLAGKLTSLDLINHNLCDKSAGQLPTLTDLTSLNVSGSYLNNSEAPPLALLTQLKSLNMSNNRLTSEGLGKLTTLVNLTSLDVSNNWLRGTNTFDDSAVVPALALLTQLTLLNLSTNLLNNEEILKLTRLTNLKSLNVEQNHVTSTEALAALDSMTNLTSLSY